MASGKQKLQPPTMADVALMAHVSTMTASRALRNAPDCRPETRARERAAALGFVLEEIWLGQAAQRDAATLAARAQRILHTRGIPAVILPFMHNSDLARTDWSDFAVAVIGHVSHAEDVRNWSGIDPGHRRLAAAAVELVIQQMQAGGVGFPQKPMRLSILGDWVHGETTR